MEVDSASERRGQIRPTTRQKEEWERAGFDAALAQAMFARPLLAPSETVTKRESAPRGSDGGSAEAARAPAEQSAASPAGDERWDPAESAEPAPVESAPLETTESGRAEEAGNQVKSTPEPGLDEAPASRVAIPSTFTPAARESATTAGAVRGEVGGAGAIGAASRPEDWASDRQEAGTDPRAEQPAPPSTSREDAAQAARVFRPVELSFDAGDGQEGRLLVSVQGQAVRATIVAPDAPRARDLEKSASELHRALREKGFRKTEVSIRSARRSGRTVQPDAEIRVPASPER